MNKNKPQENSTVTQLENKFLNMSLVFSLATVVTGATFLVNEIKPGGIIICAIGLAWPVIAEWSKNKAKSQSMGIEEAYFQQLKFLYFYEKVVTGMIGVVALARLVGLFIK